MSKILNAFAHGVAQPIQCIICSTQIIGLTLVLSANVLCVFRGERRRDVHPISTYLQKNIRYLSVEAKLQHAAPMRDTDMEVEGKLAGGQRRCKQNLKIENVREWEITNRQENKR